MDRFAIEAKDGELPHEYVARKLYTCQSFDPSSGKICTRTVRIAIKDVSDYSDTARVKGNRKMVV